MWTLNGTRLHASSVPGARAENGVLFKRGAYNFAALAHDDDAIREIEAGASGALVALRDEEDNQ
jgi:hypothetical protein